MRRIAFVLSLLATTLAYAEKIPTPYGELEVRESGFDAKKNQPIDGGIFFKGKPVLVYNTFGDGHREAIDLNSISLQGKYQLANETAVLVFDGGNGSSCPAQYFFVSVSADGAKATSEFGTCSDLIKVTPQVDSVSVSMPGFAGPFESSKGQKKAAQEKHSFTYKNGAVLGK